MHKDKHNIVNEYLDINGVKVIFDIIKDKLNLTKDELLKEISFNQKKLDLMNDKVNNLKHLLDDEYYNKWEIENLLPNNIEKELIQEAYNKGINE